MKRKRIPAHSILSSALLAAALAGGIAFSGEKAAAPAYDVLIKNARVFDGTLREPFPADVAVRDGRIVKIGARLAGTAVRTIDARGLAVTPGFIDMHTHVDGDMYFPEHRACPGYLRQGVTTVVVGQCGGSAWPIFEEAKDQIKRWTDEGIGPNAALLVGHGTVRRIVMGRDNREPTAGELEKMKALVREAMEQGASGISTGLIYMPGKQAKTPELIELVKEVAPYGGIYHSHIRNERESLLASVRELIEISEKTGVRAHISHFKVMGKSSWGLPAKAAALIEEARAKGLAITADQYPYRFTNTTPYARIIPRDIWTGKPDPGVRDEDVRRLFDGLSDAELVDLYGKATPCFPLTAPQIRFVNGLSRERLVDLVAGDVLENGLPEGPENARERALFLKRLADPEEGAKIRQALRAHLEKTGPENILVGICAERRLEGKTLAAIAALERRPVEDAAIELDLMGALSVPLSMGDADIDFIMKKDYVATGSDGTEAPFGIGLPHIRSRSTFLYKIKEYSLTRNVVTLVQAIRSQTSLPAGIMRWDDRGRVKEGCAADLVVLDLKGIEVPATVSDPHPYASGVKYLLVNGRLAIDNGTFTGTLAGRVLRPAKNG